MQYVRDFRIVQGIKEKKYQFLKPIEYLIKKKNIFYL